MIVVTMARAADDVLCFGITRAVGFEIGMVATLFAVYVRVIAARTALLQ